MAGGTSPAVSAAKRRRCGGWEARGRKLAKCGAADLRMSHSSLPPPLLPTSLEALDRSMQASRGQRATATPSSSAPNPTRRPPSAPRPPPAPPADADAATYAPLPKRALERGPVATMLKVKDGG